MADIDYQMYSLLNQIPAAIKDARASLSVTTQETNRDKGITGVACLLGAISGGLGVTFGTDISSPQPATVLGWLAQHSWGYGYWGPFLLDLQDTDPGCGLEEFNRVVAEYSFVTDIYATYGQDVTAGAYTSGNPDDRPELREYYLNEFGRKLKLELHCLTSQAGNSAEAAALVGLIEKYVVLGRERLQLTAQFM